MQIIDLAQAGTRHTHARADVCIVGAGAAGLYLAHRLAFRGLSILLVEAGARPCVDGARVGIEAICLAGEYRGTTEGRAFGIGGTTSRWGGQLLPYSELDIRRDSDPLSSAWKVVVDVVRRHSSRVYSTLGIQSTEDPFSLSEKYLGATASHLHGNGITALTSEWLPFRRRNLDYLLNETKDAPGSVTVVGNSAASRWKLDRGQFGGARVSSLEARSPNGKVLTATALQFVLAAGAIESTRILLEIERDCGKGLYGTSTALGRNLSDHLSFRIADIAIEAGPNVIAAFGPRFHRGQMRTFRFIEQFRPSNSARGFFHLIFEQNDSGFVLARHIMQCLQAHTAPQISPSDVWRGLTGMTSIAYARLVRSRLYIAPQSPMHLRLDMEQTPRDSNCVGLANEIDALGRPRATVRWNIAPEDIERAEDAARRFLESWARTEPHVPRLLPTDVISNESRKPFETYHPVGTCRLGEDQESVVRNDLSVKGVSNLSVLSTAVFPTAGTANPTFSLFCFGEALSERLAHEVRGR